MTAVLSSLVYLHSKQSVQKWGSLPGRNMFCRSMRVWGLRHQCKADFIFSPSPQFLPL